MSLKSLKSIAFGMFFATILVLAKMSPKKSPYCDPKLCEVKGLGLKLGSHIGCPGVSKSICPSDAKPVSTKMMRKIVDYINKRRNDLASGKVPHLPIPARLAEVRWDSELAKLATINAMQCKNEHDQCRNTKKYPVAGQNLYMNWYHKPEECVKKAVEGWWFERQHTKASEIESYPTESYEYDIGHFTVMVNEKSTRVGCGLVMANNSFNCYLACDFSYDNVNTKPVYTIGPAGSKCTSGRSKKYSNLCSSKEPIDYKRVEPIKESK